MTYEVTGYTTSTCSFTLAGTEYDSVRIIVALVSSCTYSPNWVPSIAFAFATGIVTAIQSPAGDVVVAVTLFLESHAFTARMLSGFGATNACAYPPGLAASVVSRDQTHLGFTQVLAVVLAPRSADIIQSLLQPRRISLRDSDAKTKHGIRVGLAEILEATRNVRPPLKNMQVIPRSGLAKRERA